MKATVCCVLLLCCAPLAVAQAPAAGRRPAPVPPRPFRSAGDDYKAGFLDSTGKVVVSPSFVSAGEFSEGLAAVCVGEKWGFVDARGRQVIAPRFVCADDFSEGVARVTVDGGAYGYVDKRGRFVIPPRLRLPPEIQYASDLSFHDGLALFASNGKWGYIDRRGRVAVRPTFQKAHRFSGRLAVVQFADGTSGFITRTGKPAFEARFAEANDFSEGLAVVGMWADRELVYGYIDRTGAYVVEPMYTAAQDMREGRALVVLGPFVPTQSFYRRGACNPITGILSGVPGGIPRGPGPQPEPGKAGFVDATGALAIPLELEGAGDFSEGLAPFRQNDRWGFVDRQGKVVIPAQYGYVNEPFRGGIAFVTARRSGQRDAQVYIDTSGRVVLES